MIKYNFIILSQTKYKSKVFKQLLNDYIKEKRVKLYMISKQIYTIYYTKYYNDIYYLHNYLI